MSANIDETHGGGTVTMCVRHPCNEKALSDGQGFCDLL